jgi:RNA polymerase sigma factor (TIGR02999 family)
MATMCSLEDEESDREPEALLPGIYDELRKIASITLAKLPAGCTLQSTALVHEAWMRIEKTRPADWQGRAHYLAAHAEAMRHVLIERFRRRRATRHGGGLQRVDIDQVEIPINMEDHERFLAISEAIDKLAIDNPEAAELVKLRIFGGLELAAAARILGMTRTTAYRRWQFATTKLYCDLRTRGSQD